MKRLKIVLLSALLTVTVGAFAGWSGSGSFTRTHDWTDDAAAGIPITASRMDAEDDNFATGINACLAKNGENAATSNLNIGGYRLTSVGAGSAATDAATIGGTETLTNKTLTAPVFGGTVTGTYTLGGTPTLDLSSVTTSGDLPVASGGSGASSFTAYGVVTGGTTTTGALQSVSPGTEMHVLKSGGASALPSFQTPYYAVTAYSTTNISIPNNTYTDLPFTSETHDSGSLHDTASNQELFVAPSWATKMRMTGVIRFNLSGVGVHGFRVVTSAGANLTPNHSVLMPGEHISVNISTGLLNVTGGSSYKIQAYQNSNTTLTIMGSSNETYVTVEFFP